MPRKVIGNSEGEGSVSEVKIFKGKYEAKLEILPGGGGGGGGVWTQKTFLAGAVGMDIFWKHTKDEGECPMFISHNYLHAICILKKGTITNKLMCEQIALKTYSYLNNNNNNNNFINNQ